MKQLKGELSNQEWMAGLKLLELQKTFRLSLSILKQVSEAIQQLVTQSGLPDRTFLNQKYNLYKFWRDL
jgi:hypothetical protein